MSFVSLSFQVFVCLPTFWKCLDDHKDVKVSGKAAEAAEEGSHVHREELRRVGPAHRAQPELVRHRDKVD